MAGKLQLGGVTVLEESGGTVTAPNNLSVTGTISGTVGSSSTIQSGTTFPTGMPIKVSSVMNNNEWQATTGSTDTEYPIFGSSTTNAHTSTNFKVEISPKSTSSKFLVSYSICVSNYNTGLGIKLYRGGLGTSPTYGSSGTRTPLTSLHNWTNDSNQAHHVSHQLLDEPSTTTTFYYYLTFLHFNTNPWFNTTSSRNGQVYDDVGTSTLTVMEIAG